MVDRLKDDEDRQLESVFRSEPVPDNGFSARVVTRLNRRIWIRRLTLPVAFLIGAAIAAKPLSQLLVTFSKLLTAIPADVNSLSADVMPQATSILLGGFLLAAMVMITKILED